MAKLNFKHFRLYTDIAKTQLIQIDARKEFADLIYNRTTGIEAHALALKIYQSEAAVEVNDSELKIITEVGERYCTPSFIDGLNMQQETTNTETE